MLIVAVIVIAVMGVFICKLYNNKAVETQRAAELLAQVDSLNATISDLQGKITSISETINNSEALTILKSKFDIIEKIYFSPDEFFNVTAGEEIKDFDKTIFKYGTDNLLKEIKNNLPTCIKLYNGKYYFMEGGGALEYRGFDSFENIKANNSTITATLKTKQSAFNGTDWVSVVDKSSEFVLFKNGNEWLIDRFNSSDLK